MPPETKSPAKKAPAAGSSGKTTKASKQAPAKPRRLEDMSRGRSGLFRFSPTMIDEEPGFNERIDYGDLRLLADQIEATHCRLEQPLKIRKEPGSERIFLTDGHRRIRAIKTILIPEGRWPHDPDDKTLWFPVDCVPEARNTTLIQRLVTQIVINNSGKPYSMQEKGNTYLRMLAEDPTLKAADIAKLCGESKQAVGDALRLMRNASPALLEALRDNRMADTTAVEIIKQAGDSHTAQDALLALTLARAANANRARATPKDIPDPLEGITWTYRQDLAGKGIRMFHHRDLEDTHRDNLLRLKGIPADTKLEFGWDKRPGDTLNYDILGVDERPGAQREPFGCRGNGVALRDCLAKGLEQVASHFKWTSHQIETLVDRAIVAVASYTAKPKPDEDSIADTNNPTQDNGDNSSDEGPSSGLTDGGGDQDPVSTEPRFSLYLIENAPTVPLANGSYHEADRLVLENLPEGFERLHLLSAHTQKGTAWGYRVNDHEELPTLGEDGELDIEEAYTGQLQTACEKLGFNPDHELTVNLILAMEDACSRYYPASGEAETPKTLPFTTTVAAADNAAVDRIKNAGPTNRDGSNVGLGNDGGFIDPTKRLQQLNKTLETLDGKGVVDRVAAANLIYNFLMNEASPAALRNFLLGQS